jgi:hypothetical protein
MSILESILPVWMAESVGRLNEVRKRVLLLVNSAKAGIQRLCFALLISKSKSFRSKERVTFCWTAKSHQKTSFRI